MSDDVAVRLVDHPPSARPFAVLLAAVAVLAAAGCTDGDDRGDGPTTASTPGTESPAGPSPTLVDADCPDPTTPSGSGADGRITCRRLVVPESRSRPDERQVELPVLTFAPAGDVAAAPSSAAPVVYLHGGPGGGATQQWATWSTVADALGTEVVVYDQRGGGASVPRLDCPEHADALADGLGAADDPELERSVVADALSACHDRLVRDGVDLSEYDVDASVADLDDLRRALGAEQLRLVASSYGTRLALEYAAAHPDRAASLALDSLDPPGATLPGGDARALDPAVERLLDACSADPSCATAHPDLGSSLDAAVSRADRTPLVIETPATDERPAGRFTLTGDDLLAGLFAAMYDSELIPLLPAAIDAIAAGDDSVLASVGPRVVPALSAGSIGALLSVNCAATSASSPVEPPVGASTIALTGWDPYCQEWPVDASASAAHGVEPGVPVLVVAGELDPITPATTSRRLADTWGATLVEVPRAGHTPMLVDPCARAVLRSFLADPDAVDTACVSRLAPTPFA